MAVILVTHNLTIVEKVSDAVAVMRLGRVLETNTTRSLFAAPQNAYTRKLLASQPSGRPNPVAPNSEIVLETDRLRVEYHLNWGRMFSRQTRLLVAVDDVSLELRSGETLGIVGESGSGKTTLGKAILKLLHNDGGTIDWKGSRLDGKSKAEMRPFRPQMQVVFQDPFGSLSPRMTVGQVVTEGLLVHEPSLSFRERDRRAVEALGEVGLVGPESDVVPLRPEHDGEGRAPAPRSDHRDLHGVFPPGVSACGLAPFPIRAGSVPWRSRLMFGM
jgi:ABC-type microcin C transport system duplicated ATPase subunit YejF